MEKKVAGSGVLGHSGSCGPRGNCGGWRGQTGLQRLEGGSFTNLLGTSKKFSLQLPSVENFNFIPKGNEAEKSLEQPFHQI